MITNKTSNLATMAMVTIPLMMRMMSLRCHRHPSKQTDLPMERVQDNFEELVTMLDRRGDLSTLNSQAHGEVEEDRAVCVRRLEQAPELACGRIGGRPR